MANFPSPGEANSFTGFINGFNSVSCPRECQLTRGSPIYNKPDYHGPGVNYDNIYNMEDISGYYCAINSGPPLHHTAAPDGYETEYYFIQSNDWSSGFSTEPVQEDEVYTNPRTDFLFNYYNGGSTCVNRIPPTDNPVPSLPTRDCQAPQSTLTWFRLNANIFK